MLLWRGMRRTPLVCRILLMLIIVYSGGCANGGSEQQKEGGTNGGGATSSDQTDLSSAHYFLSAADMEAFRPGRKGTEILEDLEWRGNFFMACTHNGSELSAVAYKLVPSISSADDGRVVFAIFTDDRFEKFVEWVHHEGDIAVVERDGKRQRRPKAVRLGDCGLLMRLLEAEPLSVADLKEAMKAKSAPPNQTHEDVDVGLTITWLLLRPAVLAAHEADLRRNAPLRDQFNASRLDTGMTQAEVEFILKTKPLESGSVEAGFFAVYGSDISLDVKYPLHFANILVVFKEGKAIAVYSIHPGSDWRRDVRDGVIQAVPTLVFATWSFK